MADIKIKIQLEGGQFLAETDKIESAVKEVEAKVSSSFTDMGSRVTAFAFKFNQITDVIQKFSSVLQKPIETFSRFESAMANVASLGVKNISALSASVLDISREIPVALDNLSNGLYQVVSAGVDAANQMQVLEVSAKAAKAGLAETTEALNLGSAIIKAYGKDWSEMESVLDQAFQTVKLGQTTFAELANSIGTAAPLAATLKVSTQELFGAMATLTGVTGNTTEVATQLRAIMAGLADPTKELSELIKEQTGLSVEQAVQQKGLAGVLKIVAEATGGSASKMTELFGRIEAVNAVLALSGSQYDTFIEKTDAMRNSSGALNEALAQQSDTLEAKLQLLKNQWDALVITVLNNVVPALTALLEVGSSILQWLTGTQDEVKKLKDEYQDLQDKIKEVDNIEILANEYETLSTKTNRTAEENARLKEVISKLAEIVPSAISAVDEYGRALDINIVSVKNFINAQRELLKRTQNKVFEDVKDEIKDNIENLSQYQLAITKTKENLKEFQSYQEKGLELVTKMVNGQAVIINVARQLEASGEKLTNYQNKLKKLNPELDRLLNLMSLFIDFENTTPKKLSAELGISVEQAQKLIDRFNKLNEQEVEVKVKPKVEKDEKTPSVEVPIIPDIQLTEEELSSQLDDFEFPSPVNVNEFEDQLNHQLEMNRLFYETGLIQEEEYQQRKLALLQQGYEQFTRWEGAKSQKALEYLAERRNAEEEFAKKQQELTAQQALGFAQIMGQMANAFQGTSESMFQIGKAAAVAQAIINTYQGATKALAEYPPPFNYIAAAAVVAAGMAQVVKIQQTKFEKKKEGGPLGRTDRVLQKGDFGDGENLIFIANDKEFLVSAEPAQKYSILLEAINQDRPASEIAKLAMMMDTTARQKMAEGGAIIDNFNNPNIDKSTPYTVQQDIKAQLDPQSIEMLRESIQNIKIEIKGVLDSMQFFRDHFGEYQRIEQKRTVIE